MNLLEILRTKLRKTRHEQAEKERTAKERRWLDIYTTYQETHDKGAVCKRWGCSEAEVLTAISYAIKFEKP